MFNLKSKIDARLEARRNGESGLALLDVLLGMAIFALIAVIAVQAMGQFRQRAYVTQATSDTKQVATGIEAFMTGPNATYAGASGAIGVAAGTAGTNVQVPSGALTTLGANLTGSTGAAYVAGGANETNYRLCVQNGNAYAVYSATQGKIIASGAGNCPASMPLT